MRIDVRGSQALQDVILALKNSDAETRRVIRTYTKATMVRPWLEAINDEAQTRLERRVISATATVSVSDQNIRIQSAAKGRKLSGGAKPQDIYPGTEFGAYYKLGDYQRRSKNGGQHRVRRLMGGQFKDRRSTGYVFYPAAREMIPRLARLWVQTVVKLYADIFEGRG